MNNKQTYRISCDDDGHWYIFPSEKKNDFDAWVDSGDEDFPDWATQIDGWHTLTFENPKEDE